MVINFLEGPDKVMIFYDTTEETPVKSTKVLESVLNSYVNVEWQTVRDIVSLKEETTALSIKTIAIYSFHGNNTGMRIGESIISWGQIAKEILENSPSIYHAFLSCKSSNLPDVNNKQIFSQKGIVDYSISVLSVAGFIARIMNEKTLLLDVASKVMQGQIGLITRFICPREPMWFRDTHYTMIDIALESMYSIPWINDALANTNVPGFDLSFLEKVDPDTEDNARMTLNNITSLAEAIHKGNQELLDKALWHVSFNVDINVNLVVPAVVASNLNWFVDENATDQTLHDLDKSDGDLDGNIIINKGLFGLGVERTLDCFNNACTYNPIRTSDYDQTAKRFIDYNWAVELSRAAHYLQDQQMPFHTALVDDANKIQETLSIEVNFNAKEKWLDYTTAEGLDTGLSEWVFSQVESAARLFTGDFSLDLFIDLMLIAYLSGTFLAIFGPVGLVGWFLIVLDLANRYLIAANNFYNIEVNGHIMDKKTEVENIHTNNLHYNKLHFELEARVDEQSRMGLNSRSTSNSWAKEVETFLSNNLDQVQTYAEQLLVTSQREALLESWVVSSRQEAQYIYDHFDPANPGIYPQDVEKKVKFRVKQATLQTAALYKAYFLKTVIETDTDDDGISDFLEEEFFGTSSSSGTHLLDSSISRIHPSKYKVYVSAQDNVPCSKIRLEISYTYPGSTVLCLAVEFTGSESQGFGTNVYSVSFSSSLDVYRINVRAIFYDHQLDINYDFITKTFTIQRGHAVYTVPVDPVPF